MDRGRRGMPPVSPCREKPAYRECDAETESQAEHQPYRCECHRVGLPHIRASGLAEKSKSIVGCPAASGHDAGVVRVTDAMELGSATQAYMGSILVARITLPHFSVSAAMNLPKSAGERTSGSLLRSANRALIAGSARTALTS